MVRHSEEALQAFHYRDVYFSREKVTIMLEGGLKRPSFFCDVIDVDGSIGGALCARIVEYMHSYEAYAQELILYIREEHRGIKGITELLRNYIAWAKSRGAREIRLAQSTGFKMEKFAVLAKRFDFEQIGTNWSIKL
jgi:hypothetical protein